MELSGADVRPHAGAVAGGGQRRACSSPRRTPAIRRSRFGAARGRGRISRRRDQHRHRPRRGGRRRAAVASRRRLHLLHRLARRRPAGAEAGRRSLHPVHAGARRQVAAGRLRGRRLRRGGAGDLPRPSSRTPDRRARPAAASWSSDAPTTRSSSGSATRFARLRAGQPRDGSRLRPDHQRQAEGARRGLRRPGPRATVSRCSREGRIADGVSPRAASSSSRRCSAPCRASTRSRSEEVFGPVLAVMPFEDEADAIRLANATEYGLVAARLDPRRRPAAARRAGAAQRPGVRQLLRRRRRHRAAVRRDREERARAREGLHGAARFLAAQDRRHQPRLRGAGGQTAMERSRSSPARAAGSARAWRGGSPRRGRASRSSMCGAIRRAVSPTRSATRRSPSRPTCRPATPSPTPSRAPSRLRRPGHRRQQRRRDASQPADPRGRRGDVRSHLRRQREVDLQHGPQRWSR